MPSESSRDSSVAVVEVGRLVLLAEEQPVAPRVPRGGAVGQEADERRHARARSDHDRGHVGAAAAGSATWAARAPARRCPSGASARNVEHTPPRPAPDGDVYRTTDMVNEIVVGETRALDEIEYCRGARRRSTPTRSAAGTSGASSATTSTACRHHVQRARSLPLSGRRRWRSSALPDRSATSASRSVETRLMSSSVVARRAAAARRPSTSTTWSGSHPVTANHSSTSAVELVGPHRDRVARAVGDLARAVGDVQHDLAHLLAGARQRQQAVADEPRLARAAAASPAPGPAAGQAAPAARSAGSVPAVRPLAPAPRDRVDPRARPLALAGLAVDALDEPRRTELLEPVVEPAPVPAEPVVARVAEREHREPRAVEPARVGGGHRLPERACRCRARRRRRTCWSPRRGRRRSAGPGEAVVHRDDPGREAGAREPLGRSGGQVLGRARLGRPQHDDLARRPRPPRTRRRTRRADPVGGVRENRPASSPSTHSAWSASSGAVDGSTGRARRPAAEPREEPREVAPLAVAERRRPPPHRARASRPGPGSPARPGVRSSTGRRLGPCRTTGDATGVSATAHTLSSGWNEIGSTASLVTALTARYSPNMSFQWNGANRAPGSTRSVTVDGQHGPTAARRDLDRRAVDDARARPRRTGASRRTAPARACSAWRPCRSSSSCATGAARAPC